MKIIKYNGNLVYTHCCDNTVLRNIEMVGHGFGIIREAYFGQLKTWRNFEKIVLNKINLNKMSLMRGLQVWFEYSSFNVSGGNGAKTIAGPNRIKQFFRELDLDPLEKNLSLLENKEAIIYYKGLKLLGFNLKKDLLTLS